MTPAMSVCQFAQFATRQTGKRDARRSQLVCAPFRVQTKTDCAQLVDQGQPEFPAESGKLPQRNQPQLALNAACKNSAPKVGLADGTCCAASVSQHQRRSVAGFSHGILEFPLPGRMRRLESAG